MIRLAYRAEIDGLRAVAVLLVLAYHAFPTLVPGGFIGVDVFFVISGFLITRILLADLERGQFSLGAFYAHRIRRIFPALACVLLFVLAAGWLVLLPGEFVGVGRHAAASAAFVQNHALWNESGYFAIDIERKPLMHLWSLAVEEQFYLVWPVVLWLAWRRTWLFALVALAAVASFAVAWAGLLVDPVGSYYLLPYRAWELLVGAGLAVRGMGQPVGTAEADASAAQRRHQAMALAGAACIVFAAFWIDKHDPYPGWRALLPVAGAALCIAAAPTAWVHAALLRHPVLVAVGLISYPLYLWHWPLLSLANFASPEPTALVRGGALVLAMVLSWLTYVAIEKPVRAGNRLGGRWLAPLFAVGALGAAGLFVLRADGFPQRLPQIEHITRYAKEPTHYPGTLQPAVVAGRNVLVQPARDPRLTLYVGDSNMMQYYARLEHLVVTEPQRAHGFVFHAFTACLPMPGLRIAGTSDACAAMLPDALAIAGDARVTTVVIAANWNTYLVDRYGMPRDYRFGDATYRLLLQGLQDWLAQLVRQGKRVVVVLNTPIGRDLDPGYMVRRDFSGWPVFRVHSAGRERADLDSVYGAVQRDVAQAARAAGAGVIDPFEHLCNAVACPSLDAQGVPIYSDKTHLRSGYVREQLRYLDETLRPR